MSSPARKKATAASKSKKSSGAESDSEGGRPSRTKRAPERLDPAEGASGSDTPRRGSARRRSLSVERKKKRGPGRPRKTSVSGSRSPAKKNNTRATATKRRRTTKKEDDEEAKEYEVEKLLDVQFLVKWKGYAKSSATWEPVKNLGACDDMVLAYLDKVKQQLLDAAEERKNGEEEEEKKKKGDEDESEDDDENEAEKEKEKEKKRKAADAEKEAPSTPKRPRGRPPKKPKITTKDSDKEEAD
jgi:hypothetical protein